MNNKRDACGKVRKPFAYINFIWKTSEGIIIQKFGFIDASTIGLRFFSLSIQKKMELI